MQVKPSNTGQEWEDFPEAGQQVGQWMDYLQRGQRVDVVIGLRVSAPADENADTSSDDVSAERTVVEHISLNAIVERVNESRDETALDLLLTRDDAHQLQLFIEADFPMTFIPAIPQGR